MGAEQRRIYVYKTHTELVSWHDRVGDMVTDSGQSWLIIKLSSPESNLSGLTYRVATLRAHKPLPAIKQLNQNGTQP